MLPLARKAAMRDRRSRVGEVGSNRNDAPSVVGVHRWTILGAAALLALAALVASMNHWVALDDAVWRAVLTARGCGTDRLVERAIGVATATLALLLLAATIGHVAAVGPRSAWPWLATWALGLLVGKAMKHVFTRDRPSALPDLTVGYSFPSAHVMNGMLAMLVVVALARAFRHRSSWVVVATVAVGALVGGRVMLGRHWATDVLGGALAAFALGGLATPAIARRPVAVPLVLAGLASTALALDVRLGSAGIRLPSPLLARHAAVVDVDVGPEMTSPRSGDWREAGLERPFGSYLWLEGSASIVLSVPASRTDLFAAARLALGGRPEKQRGSCMRLDVTLNGRRLARFVPFVGWREYRFAIPPGVLRAGDNELRIDAERDGRSARFGVTYARIASSRSPSE